ncbi:hypothetical protein MCUN1_001692 [Malassezia cuniculi]|uniref:Uncharacterized protein n=1 Tax=Malassezia cuniculi TaxID=948313 RepID=A0AAF0EQ84_9BASI|nr:hypothetical protein MCUN1_001692 [Malassezia cuniculi]
MAEHIPDAPRDVQPGAYSVDVDAGIETASDTSQEHFSAAQSEAADWADADWADVQEERSADDPAKSQNAQSADTDSHAADETAHTVTLDDNNCLPSDSRPADTHTEPSSQHSINDAADPDEQRADSNTPEALRGNSTESTQNDTQAAAAADDFDDDFGDFEEGEAEIEEQPTPTPAPATLPEPSAKPIDIEASIDVLTTQMQLLLPPEFGPNAPGLGQDDIRQVEGASQVLVTESSRTLFRELHVEDAPPALPLNWKRSQTRRQQLIALGVPINLDEVQQKELPPLELHIEPTQAPEPENPQSATPVAAEKPAPAVPQERQADRRRRELGVDVPVVDAERIKQVTALTEEDLKLQSLPALRNLVKELQTLSAQTTELLAYHLMLRDMFSADSETYNAMIKDLVAGASSRVANRRRGSLNFIGRSNRPGTSSGRSTPS